MNIYKDQFGNTQMPSGWSRLPKVEKEEMKKQYIASKLEEFDIKVLDHIIQTSIIQEQKLDVNPNDWRWKKRKSGLMVWQDDEDERYVEEKPVTGFQIVPYSKESDL